MSYAIGNILLVDDDPLPARALARELNLRGWDVRVAGSGAEALDLAGAQRSDVVLCDLHMAGMDGVTLIEQLVKGEQAPIAFLVSGDLDIASTVRAVRAGACDVLPKPVSAANLDARLRALLPSREAAPVAPPTRCPITSTILGDAPAIRAVREQIRTVARYRDLPVLITGETGTGKELVAQAVHASSETDGPFVPVNCAAIPESLFESELFGHDAGAFTGARGARSGLFEVAASGTLFLDEIGELPSSLQPKLLRALETRSFRRVGSTRDLPFRARVISATHRNLTSPDSTLRSDLYYRLAGFTVATPSLRDRTQDLEVLARYFLADFAQRYGVRVEFSPRALEALHAYDWPGNVRELRAVVQQAAVLCTGECVGVAELMAALRDRQQRPQSTQGLKPISSSQPLLPSEPLRSMERRTILETWESSGKNLSAAARALGLPRTTLRDRLRKYGLR
ncbi:MAG TPA: sigma-54 dependent transcriptional regulator [Polyangiales bacterium]